MMDFFSKFCCIKGSDRKNQGKKDSTWRIFSLKELQLATNNFNYDNKLGEGGFGSVYWGQLWDGSQIAVKRLKSWSNKAEVEFSVEVEILARHSAECHLDWPRRMNIAVGAAEGIAYLHHYATPHIIHRDIKASNVLLDSDFKAQVADFGFAKFIPDGATHVTTRVKGTLGYLAPEYAMLGKASENCDVYSFGILLLELASGKKPIEKLSSTIKRPITDWALPLARERNFSELADERLNGNYVEEEMKRIVFVGLVCADNRPEKRPAMLDVVELLKGDKEKFAALEDDEIFKNTVAADSAAEDSSEIMSEDKEPKQEIEDLKT
ncbi:UNVERIFIED_CONTAM: PTI1-like tyrosine-protein kinase [Sesamum radiatum]|uniref:PTI1-like tyrosine-protein kinase n=1 Tax=Sesamum radiatum TaxID=300843 RepID=A0AAW2V789_SESRA